MKQNKRLPRKLKKKEKQKALRQFCRGVWCQFIKEKLIRIHNENGGWKLGVVK